jgi:hypothetical protein
MVFRMAITIATTPEMPIAPQVIKNVTYVGGSIGRVRRMHTLTPTAHAPVEGSAQTRISCMIQPKFGARIVH